VLIAVSPASKRGRDFETATEGGMTMATASGGERPATGSRPAGMARRGAWLPARQDHSSETKPFYLTSEFLVFSL